ncbi:carbohydrate ABC transporter permease [Microbacterium sp. CIAB417]|uniref:carbohydrate ABC transporter permease n=1 Tax=Microbacterium sp. CIAB417 TaxID=2860287 RepID=UPI001FAD19ED|nr:sugar ABC transporter permease [Microbacterium sp. CIAB417]
MTDVRPKRRSPLKSFGGVPFIIPSFAILLLVVIIPIVMSLYFSFTKYSVLGSPSWIGADNYLKLLDDDAFLRSLVNTLVYTVIAVPLQTIIALVLADLIAKRFRNRFGSVVRSALFIPVMSSMVVVAVVWRTILGTNDGVVNNVIDVLGFDRANFLGDPTLAMLVVALVTVWKNIGYFLVIYYAGIMEVPTDLYEASALDGASRRQQLWHVTIPALRPVTLLVIILGTIWSFQVFDLVYVMTGGGPGGATTTIVMMIFQAGFKNFQMGYASAMAIILFVLILAIAIIQRKVVKSNGR